MDELTLGLKPLDEILVAVLAEAALELGNRVGKRTRVIKRIDKRRHTRFLADAEVVFAVCGSDMHKADTVIRSDIVVVRHAESALGLLVGEIRENRLVFRILEFFALAFPDDFVHLFILENERQTGLRHHVNGTGLVGHIAHGNIIKRCAGANRKI